MPLRRRVVGFSSRTKTPRCRLSRPRRVAGVSAQAVPRGTGPAHRRARSVCRSVLLQESAGPMIDGRSLAKVVLEPPSSCVRATWSSCKVSPSRRDTVVAPSCAWSGALRAPYSCSSRHAVYEKFLALQTLDKGREKPLCSVVLQHKIPGERRREARRVEASWRPPGAAIEAPTPPSAGLACGAAISLAFRLPGNAARRLRPTRFLPPGGRESRRGRS